MKINKNKNGPLHNWKIIDLSRVLGGPYCTQLLGDLGAYVIKIEPPQGDETRDWGPPFEMEESAYFKGINRNKKSISIDISSNEGQKILFKLLENADCIVENFKTGTLEKWGIGYETLKIKFPKLIHCQVSGFGNDGPLGSYPGYDALLQAMCGWFSVNGYPDSEGVRMGIPLIDLATGLFASNAILAAAIERQISNEGQKVEVSLFDTGVALQHPHAPNWFASNKIPNRVGNAHTNIAPYDSFPTQTIPIYMSVGNNKQFKLLCSILGDKTLSSDPLFINNKDRVNNIFSLRKIIIKLLSDKKGEKIAEQLLKAGVPAGPILDIKGILEHPHTQHRKMVVKKDNYQGLGIPIKFERTPGSIRFPPPLFSEHTREILHEVGYDDTDIKNLINKNIISSSRKK
ncbi:CoA transferase [Alphaproteobacteria bacterium]|nr:CoA transferase [Alphaproteobacteria bacterium]